MAAKSTKSRKNSKSRPKKGQQNSEIRGEIIILAVLAVCILLVLSNFGVGGIAGEAVSSVFFGLFGFMAYLLPFVIFGLAAFLISNKGNTHAYIKIAAAIMLFLFITAILELIFNSYTPRASLLSYYTEASEHRNAGGLTGGCLVSLLCPLIGIIGTYVVLIILSVICIILITEKSLLAPLGKKSRKAYEQARQKRQETAVIRAKRREEKKKEEQKTRKGTEENDARSGNRRADKKFSGVSFATTLSPEDSSDTRGKRGRRKSPEVKELTPNMTFDEPPAEPFANDFVIHRAVEDDPAQPDPFSDTIEPEGTTVLSDDTAEMPKTAAQPVKASRRRNKQDIHELTVETENVAAAVKAQEEEKRRAEQERSNAHERESMELPGPVRP